VLLTVLFVVAGFIATGVLPVREYLERGNTVDAAQLELDRLTAENQAMADDIDALYTEQEVERVAREQYGFVRPGEVGYVVITPEVDSVVSEPAPPVATVVEDRSFLQRFWDFVTGNDQAHDG
jgi:cell division protein FtsB